MFTCEQEYILMVDVVTGCGQSNVLMVVVAT